MVLVTSWLDFLTQSQKLYVERPSQTRYSIKYRPSDSEVTLKVTDDRTTLTFHAHTSDQLKCIEKINGAFIKLMTAKQPETVTLADELSEEKKGPTKFSTSTKSKRSVRSST